MALNLVVTSHNLRITWRRCHSCSITALTLLLKTMMMFQRPLLLLRPRLRSRRWWRRRDSSTSSTVFFPAMSVSLGLLHVVVRRMAVLCITRAIAACVGDRLVFVGVVVLRVFGDDVPGVQKAGDVAKTAKREVYQGVCGAETGFDPNWSCS